MIRRVLVFILAILALHKANPQGYAGYTGCLEQDSLALVAFYYATDGPNWTSNQPGFSIDNLSDNVLTYYTVDYPYAGMGKWLVGPVKDWFGVLLEKQPVGNTTDSVWRVVHLRPTISRRSAGNNKLKGYIPKEVGLLTALKWFKVNGNIGLAGSELPKEIYHPTLEEFDIEAVYFKGVIEDDIKKCTNLKMVNIRYNNLDSIPVFDFLKPEHLEQYFGTTGSTFQFYNNNFSYATLEPTIEYFMSVSKNIKYEARQLNNVGRAIEIVATPGSTIVLSCNEAGKNGSYTWYKNGFNTYKKGSTYTINNISAADTGKYTVLLENEFIRLNDQNKDYVNSFTKPIHVTFSPSIPKCISAYTNYSGNEIELSFSKPMAVPVSAQANEFVVLRNGNEVKVIDIFRRGRLLDKLVLITEIPLEKDDVITISYIAGTIKCVNGGMLQSFNSFACTNLIREKPTLISAVTRTDGEGIILTFDKFIDPSSVNITEFEIKTNRGNLLIDEARITNGYPDKNISKSVELIVSDPLLNNDTITVSYQGTSLKGLYGSFCRSFKDVEVLNRVSAKRTIVYLSVIDGTKNLKNVVVKGGMRSRPFNLFDNGTNGDIRANDHHWTVSIPVVDGSYSWQVFERKEILTYDTLIITDENGVINIKLTPRIVVVDSLVSTSVNLRLNVFGKTVTGDTVFGFFDKSVLFILDMTGVSLQSTNGEYSPYLMGIRNDWTNGIKMLPFQEERNLFYVLVEGFNTGDVIRYNFRNNNVWENISPVTRIHTVIGDDTIRAKFGIFPVNIDYIATTSSTIVYPNPAKDRLFVSNQFREPTVKIFYPSGNLALVTYAKNNEVFVHTLMPGNYIIHITSKNGQTAVAKFIKKR